MPSQLNRLILSVMPACALLLLWSCRSGALQNAPKSHEPTVSQDRLTREQLAVYKAVLAEAYNRADPPPSRLAVRTSLLDDSTYKACAGMAQRGGAEMEPRNDSTMHRFRAEDLPAITDKPVRLEDMDAISGSPAATDTMLAAGVYLSEISFEQSHQYAIVRLGIGYGYRGESETLIMKKDSASGDVSWRPWGTCMHTSVTP